LPTPDSTIPVTPARRILRAPSWRLRLLEQRALFEVGAMVAANPLLRLARRGDATPVLVLPGFTADDLSTVALRSYLRSWGYLAHGWRLGANFGPTQAVPRDLSQRLVVLHTRHDGSVVLIGQSAGGMYARYLARSRPEQVRQVITLGSPLQMQKGDRSSVGPIMHLIEHRFDPDFLTMAQHQRGRLPVPATSIYTRTDASCAERRASTSATTPTRTWKCAPPTAASP